MRGSTYCGDIISPDTPVLAVSLSSGAAEPPCESLPSKGLKLRSTGESLPSGRLPEGFISGFGVDDVHLLVVWQNTLLVIDDCGL